MLVPGNYLLECELLEINGLKENAWKLLVSMTVFENYLFD